MPSTCELITTHLDTLFDVLEEQTSEKRLTTFEEEVFIDDIANIYKDSPELVDCLISELTTFLHSFSSERIYDYDDRGQETLVMYIGIIFGLLFKLVPEAQQESTIKPLYDQVDENLIAKYQTPNGKLPSYISRLAGDRVSEKNFFWHWLLNH